MTVVSSPRIVAPDWRRRIAALASATVLGACALQITPSATPATPSPGGTQTAAPTPTPVPTASPIPRLTLPEPAAADPRAISYTVTVELEPAGSGRIVITVTNLTDELVDELVLRWPTEVRETVYLAPFEPTQERIREGGLPLVQDWTTWVDGPGEHGEPAGTTSLGWGPLLPRATLTIPVVARRVAPGPLSFDLQILAGEAVLTSDGGPAWLHVSVP